MAREIRYGYYEDNYVKYDCDTCKKSFIVGETLAEGINLACPYCRSDNVEPISMADEGNTEDMDMGCLGITFHRDKDGSLMLITDREFTQAMKNVGKTLDSDRIRLVIEKFCARRDGRTS